MKVGIVGQAGPGSACGHRREPHSRTATRLLPLSLALLVLSAGRASSVSVQPGWPQTTGAPIESSPALGDLDGDGKLEVVVGSYGILIGPYVYFDHNVYAWRQDGSPVAGWPQTTGDAIFSSPAIADLDGDGELEVVCGSEDRYVYAWHRDGSPVAGWPQVTGSGVSSSPALADLDGDGELEVVIGSEDHNVYAWHHDGSLVTGWPQTTGWQIASSPAIGDLEGDGDLEVVVGSADDKVYAWHHDGSPVAGWPQSTGGIVVSSPALGDLDGDGELEVVVGSAGNVYAWHHDGSPVAGWPQVMGMVGGSPALGDLDGDGDLEVVVCSDKVYAWHHDGSLVTGWPQAMGGIGSPALGDLDGDGEVEVVACSDKVYAWHHDGALVDGWPQSRGAGTGHSSPALGDLEGDGDLEVVVGSADQSVYAWSCDTPTGDSLAWPMFHHDLLRTGLYGASAVAPGAQFTAYPTVGPVSLSVAFTDQSTDNPSSWSWDFGDGATSTQQNPVHEFKAVGQYTVSLSVVTDAGRGTVTKKRCIMALFPDVPTAEWAWRQVSDCSAAKIVSGYDDGLYHPERPITRAEMAAYLARAIAGGDDEVPSARSYLPSFQDVPFGSWAYRYVEYLVANDALVGYEGRDYWPDAQVTRDQMAVFIARAMVAPGGDAAIPDPVPPATFPDVLPDFWAWKHVEYCVEHGVVEGYDDGYYHPEIVVTRDQMAVYIARAFGLM